MERMSQDEIKEVEQTDFTNGQSPLRDNIEAEVLSNDEKNALIAGQTGVSLTQQQLKNILKKCHKYELNVTKNRISTTYIKSITKCINDFEALVELAPKARAYNKDLKKDLEQYSEQQIKVSNKIVRKVEKKLVEIIELMLNHEEKVIPMEILAKLSQIQNTSEVEISE